ncbi:hypothetical protein HME7025_00082 [Aquirufa nivalisilvae]|uniref:DUF7936 domain-containing protein n=1 Tax=Aquirufa nivalisilvae TaxID=2516557 RepID=A0A2S2DT08_9BACT|nr:hypothetical protein [Aquirufa nivalisilvae]AWL07967.1 hypothetical protein HME7025_00082 [Aquirufa nivalisilvae]
MSKTYNWIVSKVEAIPQLGELTNVVSDIHYRRVITDENGKSTDIFDIAQIPAPSDLEVFIPADKLTFDDYCIMLEKHLEVKKIDQLLDEKYANIFPPILKVELPLAWIKEIEQDPTSSEEQIIIE